MDKNSYEWQLKVNKMFSVDIKTSPDGCLLLGIRHANNMIKHNFNFWHEHVLVHQTTIPQTLPFYMEAEYRWIVAGKEFEGEFPNQKRNYGEYLAGKEIISTIRKSIDFLKVENRKYYASSDNRHTP